MPLLEDHPTILGGGGGGVRGADHLHALARGEGGEGRGVKARGAGAAVGGSPPNSGGWRGSTPLKYIKLAKYEELRSGNTLEYVEYGKYA